MVNIENQSKILLCEDEEFVARSYTRKLELEGFAVVLAKNGVIATEMIKTEKPDLILLDLLMPLKTGFEVLREIQEGDDEELKKIPIIVSSNLGQNTDIEESKKLGAVDYLVKSNISLKELVEKVKQHLPNT
jgi:DNA-binding response OmpR family regulator